MWAPLLVVVDVGCDRSTPRRRRTAQDHPARRLLRGCHPRWRTTEADLARFAAWWSPQDLPGQQVQVALGDMGMSSMMGGTAPSDARMMLRAWPTSVPAGQVSFVVANLGWRTGEVSASCGADAGEGITSGSAGWTTLRLPPGRYELVCNLPNHYAAGMYQELRACQCSTRAFAGLRVG